MWSNATPHEGKMWHLSFAWQKHHMFPSKTLTNVAVIWWIVCRKRTTNDVLVELGQRYYEEPVQCDRSEYDYKLKRVHRCNSFDSQDKVISLKDRCPCWTVGLASSLNSEPHHFQRAESLVRLNWIGVITRSFGIWLPRVPLKFPIKSFLYLLVHDQFQWKAPIWLEVPSLSAQ